MALPRWFPFHLDKVSYWSRTVIVPLLVLMAQRPLARNRARRRRARVVRDAAGSGSSDWYNCNRTGAWASLLPRRRSRAAARARSCSRSAARALHRDGGDLGRRAAERRGRARRDLSRDGQLGDDVRRARLSGGSSGARHRARLAGKADGDPGRPAPIASPACRRCGTRRWPRHALLEAGGEAAEARDSGVGLAEGPPDPGRRRRLGGRRGRACGPAAGPSSIATTIIPMSTIPRSSCMAMDRADRERYRESDRARDRVDLRPAEQEWRLGLVRRGQRILLPEPHPVRRSRRAAGPADGRRLRALPVACWRSSATSRIIRG